MHILRACYVMKKEDMKLSDKQFGTEKKKIGYLNAVN
jgi:hypothetical protein